MMIQTISREFLVELKLSEKRAYRIAQEAGIESTWLSKAINGIVSVEPGDPRVVAIGRVLGLPAEKCFVESGEQEK